MSSDHFRRSISRDANVEVSALSPDIKSIEWDRSNKEKVWLGQSTFYFCGKRRSRRYEWLKWKIWRRGSVK